MEFQEDFNEKNKLKLAFEKFKEKTEDLKFNLSSIKININENDSYLDKTFFAFLADLLKYKQEPNLHNKLVRLVKENEELTREKFTQSLWEEMEKYKQLEENVLEKIGLKDADFDKLETQVKDKEYFIFSLVSNKFNNLKEMIKNKTEKEQEEILEKDIIIRVNDINKAEISEPKDMKKVYISNNNEIKKELPKIQKLSK
ncbi:TPA: hypothetical protein ACX8VE_001700 [Campylobacter jejuni]